MRNRFVDVCSTEILLFLYFCMQILSAALLRNDGSEDLIETIKEEALKAFKEINKNRIPGDDEITTEMILEGQNS